MGEEMILWLKVLLLGQEAGRPKRTWKEVVEGI